MSNDSLHIAQTVQTQIQGIGIANVLFRMKRLAREGIVFKIQSPRYTRYSLRRVNSFIYCFHYLIFNFNDKMNPKSQNFKQAYQINQVNTHLNSE